ncbi:uncharacterized protein EDB91DRAFT_1267575 [Suillus paluster]|uniref:uncharacterized protein n=1 Tax=Suillus paluster TaxID=48578 RepID=UPI001B86AB9D|nr:uncharacterized protein EDB91DRAFT_1267575 [Suillus paluster]KAG1725158.1 hypothetical protein EDB91DRAFT_1267575 [Suillus paluster]
MPIVSNDPSTWSLSDDDVAASAGVMYDWGKQDKYPGTADILMVVFPALTFGQEVELIWDPDAAYVSYSPFSVPTIPVTDLGCLIMDFMADWTNITINVILGVIMITRLHAMYQQSRKVLILLGVIFLIVNITSIAIQILADHTMLGDVARLTSMTWILGTVWEVLALCLAVWIAVKHFRELRQQLTGGILGDCFTVLMKSHVGYFASFVAVSCFEIGYELSTMPADPYSLKVQIYVGFILIFEVVQLFVLGPHLILAVREYHAKLVDDSDAATAMTSIAFQERVHVSTSSSV